MLEGPANAQSAQLDAGTEGEFPFMAVHTPGTNLINLSTTRNKGSTVLVVWVKGEPCNFTLDITEGLSGPQRYVIEAERPIAALNRPVPEGTGILATDLDFEIVQVTSPSDGVATAFFTLTNSSQSVIAADSTRVRFIQNGNTYRGDVTKEPRRLLIQPGETHTGYILLRNIEAGRGEISWAHSGDERSQP